MGTRVTVNRDRRSPLSRLFDSFNKTFFRGRLPKYRVRLRILRRCLDDEYGHCDDHKRIIYIDRGLDPESERRTLLHEMCHIGTRGHGKRFQAKLARLAQLGESWAEEERTEYEEALRPRRSLTALVKSEIKDVAMAQPDLPWLKARKLICLVVCKTPAELRRIAPWARAQWKKEAAVFLSIRAPMRDGDEA